MDPLTMAKIGTTVAPIIAGLFRSKPKGPDYNKIYSEYMNANPEATVTDADRAAASRTRGGITASAMRSAQMAAGNAQRQSLARNLGGPAAAALRQQAGSLAAAGREQGAMAEAGQLYQTGLQNQAYARQKQDRLFGAKLGQAQNQMAQQQASDRTFWNSMMGLSSATANLWGGGGGTTGVTGPTAAYNNLSNEYLDATGMGG